MEPTVFYVQCASGKLSHVKEVIPGTPLEEKCKERAARGFLDAFCLGSDECPECLIDQEMRDSEFARTCAVAGCAFGGDHCRDGCVAASEAVLTGDSPYIGQLRRPQH